MARIPRVPVPGLSPGALLLDEVASHHLGHVLRLGPGARVLAFDPAAGTEADLRVVRGGQRLACEVGELRQAAGVSRTGVTLVQALGKADKPEEVVRDATALGVERVVLAQAARSVPRADPRRRERLTRVALSAAAQSGRGDLPAIVGPLPLGDALLALVPGGLRVVLAPGGGPPLSERVGGRAASEPLVLLVGPEGGLTDAELDLAEAQGFSRATLFEHVLRTELAAVAAVAAALAVTRAR